MNWYKIAQQQQFKFVDDMEESIAPSRTDLIDLEEALEYNTHNYHELISLLNNYKIEWQKIDFPKADPIIKLTYKNKPYIIDDFENPSLKDPMDWIYRIFDHYLDDYVPTTDFNETFWDNVGNGSLVYHATTEENKDSILQNGLNIADKTRGINNRNTGSAIFASESTDDIGSYGDVIFAIDLGKMKNDKYMPQVTKEGPIETSEQRGALANKIGIDDIDFSSEYASEGLYDTTVIFYNNIPAKYLRLL